MDNLQQVHPKRSFELRQKLKMRNIFKKNHEISDNKIKSNLVHNNDQYQSPMGT